MISLERARELLGPAGHRLSDEEVRRLCRELEALARSLYRQAVAAAERSLEESAA